MDNVTQKLTKLANAVRTMSGTVGKLSVDDATNIAGSAGQWGVRVPNLISDSSDQYQAIPSTNSFKFYQGPVKANTKYTLQATVKNSNADLILNSSLYDSEWNWVGKINSLKVMPAQNEGTLQMSFTPQKSGYVMCNIMPAKDEEKVSGEYKCAMLNEGDYAPYTSATKPYTVDELETRLEKLENKLGGVINPVLSAFRRVVAPLMGGVAYVA